MEFEAGPTKNSKDSHPKTHLAEVPPADPFEGITPDQIREKFKNEEDEIHSLIRSTVGAVLSSQKDRSMFEDLIQKVSLKVWQKADTFDGRAKLATWIYAIAKNTLISDYLRVKQGRNVIREGDLPLNSAGEPTTLENLNPDENIEDNMILGLDLQKEMDNLPEDVRAIVPMLVNGYSRGEIAKKIGIGVGALKSRLHRYRLAIKSKRKI